MAAIQDIYRLLLGTDDPAVDRAMAACLPTASPLDVRLLSDALRHRGRPEGLVALVGQFDRLPEDTQRQLLVNFAALVPAVRRVAEQGSPAVARRAVELIRRAGRTELAYLVTQQLRRGDGELSAHAAAALAELVERSTATPRPGENDSEVPEAPGPRAPEDVLAALTEAVRLYGLHQQPAVLDAALGPGARRHAPLWAVLSDTRHAAVAPLRKRLAEATTPRDRRALLWLIPVGTLREPAIRGVRAACERPKDAADVLTQHHALHLAGVNRALRRQAVWPRGWDAADWPAEAQRGLPAWACATAPAGPARTPLLDELHTCPDPTARLLAAGRLATAHQHSPQPETADALMRLTRDGDARVARVAAVALIHRPPGDRMHLLTQLVNTPHEAVRRIAGRRLAPVGFRKLWDAWPTLDPKRRLTAGGALIKIDPLLHRQLGQKLTRPSTPDRLRALSMIHGLGQGGFFEKPLIQLLRHPDPRTASAAARALSSADSPDARRALAASLRHADPRVRANAIDALARADAALEVRRLSAMAQGEDARPRASAIDAMLRREPAAAIAALCRMLDDTRPRHRTSALWLIEHHGLIELATRVGEHSITDPDPAVRDRAGHVVERLIALMAEPDPLDDGHPRDDDAPAPPPEEAAA